jgi:hypothetical protein
VDSFAKIFAKIMANQMQPMAPALVAPCQNAFIKHQGVIHSLKHKKIPALVLKLDISKAVDSVSWEFLLELLMVLWCKFSLVFSQSKASNQPKIFTFRGTYKVCKLDHESNPFWPSCQRRDTYCRS